MSLEDIDDKFEDVAKAMSSKETKKDEVIANPTESESTNYEDSISKNKISPLLSMFEDHLRKQQSSDKKNDLESDEEFNTINIGELQITPSVQSPASASEVTEEEIESLLNFSKPKVVEIKKETSVQTEVYSQKRYGELHATPENIAQPKDLNIKYAINSSPTGGPENIPTENDVVVGLKPVNVSEKYKKNNPAEQTNIQVEPVKSIETTDDVVSPEVMEHIKNHKKKRKTTSETDETLKN
jgi:hypothetical protein